LPWGAWDTIKGLDTIAMLKNVGINFIDTANRYGKGFSESMIGFAFRNGILPPDFSIVSKIPAGTSEEMHNLAHESIARIMAPVSGFLLHNPDMSKIKELDAACKWISDSNYSIRGISTEPSREAVRAIKCHGLDAIEFPYSKWDRRAEDEIFPFLDGNEFVIVNRVLGGPEIEKKMSIVEDGMRFIIENCAKIKVALIGTSNPQHLQQVAEIFNEGIVRNP
jgi:aryl-alcohol dehydrogenase-like predicted oxidoreductase